MKITFLVLLVAASMTACGIGKQGAPREFPVLGQVTSVKVVGHDGSTPLVKVTNPQKVSQIVVFIDSHRTGWIKPWYGIPVPAVTAELFDGTQFKGSFGVGNDFFETQRAGSFFSQRASSVEVRHFLDLLDVDEEGTRYFKEDHLTGADYLAVRPDGSYTLKDRECPARLTTISSSYSRSESSSRSDVADSVAGGVFSTISAVVSLTVP